MLNTGLIAIFSVLVVREKEGDASIRPVHVVVAVSETSFAANPSFEVFEERIQPIEEPSRSMGDFYLAHSKSAGAYEYCFISCSSQCDASCSGDISGSSSCPV